MHYVHIPIIRRVNILIEAFPHFLNSLIDRYQPPRFKSPQHAFHCLLASTVYITDQCFARLESFGKSTLFDSWLVESGFQQRGKHSHIPQHLGNMAPDINSLPPSPYSPRRITFTSSRRAGDTMAPPPAPGSPPAQSPTILSREPFTNMTSGDNTGVGIGPGMRAQTLHIHLQSILQLTQGNLGPLRHPRPLTAADLHMQLEKEQEAVVSWRCSTTWEGPFCSLKSSLGQPPHTRALSSTPAVRFSSIDYLFRLCWST